jgi:intermembrane space import and assembly protein 40
MSRVFKDGKDTIIFVTKEDHQSPSNVVLSPPEPTPRLILPDGSINWSFPSLRKKITGPCGVEFRESLACFHYGKKESKGMKCRDKFIIMSHCMHKYPELYKNDTMNNLEV